MERAQIHIACNIDENYVKYCIVMITSLLENNRESEICIHIIAEKLEKESIALINSIVVEKYHQNISFHFISPDMLRECSINGSNHISMATYYRVFLETVLPTSIKKLIYLDCDLIVNGSILELWETNIENYAVAAVEDMWSGKKENYIRLNYNEEYSYFNAGVLLINLDYWRKIRFQEMALEFIKKYKEKLIFNDQDVLNGIFHDKKIMVPFKWNMQDGFYRRKKRIKAESLKRLNENIKLGIIIHYTGSKKPWQYNSSHPLKSLYFKYIDFTKWKGERPYTPLEYKFKIIADKILYLLHLKKTKYIRL